MLSLAMHGADDVRRTSEMYRIAIRTGYGWRGNIKRLEDVPGGLGGVPPLAAAGACDTDGAGRAPRRDARAGVTITD